MSKPAGNERFAQTRWSLVAVAQNPESGDAAAAWNHLCQAYWFPLYAHLRRSGYSPERAEDLTQDFFAWFIEHAHIERADKERGKLRTFLLHYLKNFARNQYKKETAQKRGAEIAHVSIDQDWAESRIGEPVEETRLEEFFDRDWARSIMENALTRVRESYEKKDKAERFQVLRPFLTPGDEPSTYEEIATLIQVSVGAVKGMVHRLRESYRNALMSEIRDTLDSPSNDEVESELSYLLQVVRNG